MGESKDATFLRYEPGFDRTGPSFPGLGSCRTGTSTRTWRGSACTVPRQNEERLMDRRERFTTNKNDSSYNICTTYSKTSQSSDLLVPYKLTANEKDYQEGNPLQELNNWKVLHPLWVIPAGDRETS